MGDRYPIVGIAFPVYTIYKSVAGVPSPYDRFPWGSMLGWLALGALLVAAAPGVVRRIGEALTRGQSE